MHISIKASVKDFKRQLSSFEKKQLPFAISSGINLTAEDARKSLYLEMRRVFHKPVAYTVPTNLEKLSNRKAGALFIVPAKKRRPQARVFVKEMSFGKGTPALNYLEPHIKGGVRRAKGSEVALRSRGVIGSGKYITPSTKSPYGHVKLNRAGNVTAGVMNKVLSGLHASRGPTKGSESRQTESYFAMRRGGPGTETGIWRRSGKGLEKLFNVTNQPQYRVRFHYDSVGKRAVDRNIVRNLDRAMADAIRTAF